MWHWSSEFLTELKFIPRVLFFNISFSKLYFYFPRFLESGSSHFSLNNSFWEIHCGGRFFNSSMSNLWRCWAFHSILRADIHITAFARFYFAFFTVIWTITRIVSFLSGYYNLTYNGIYKIVFDKCWIFT